MSLKSSQPQSQPRLSQADALELFFNEHKGRIISSPHCVIFLHPEISLSDFLKVARSLNLIGAMDDDY